MSGIDIKSVTTKVVTNKNLKKPSSSSRGGHFTVDLNESDSKFTVSSNLGAQAIDPLFSNLFDDSPSHEASKKAEEILDQLEKIRLSLIQGRLPLSIIESLASSIKSIPPQNDAKLQTIINEIETRALVELAKIEKINTPQG